MNRKLEDEVFGLVDIFCDSLPVEQCQDMKDLAIAGEPGVAYENLCTQLFEFDVALTEFQLNQIRQAGLAMGIDPKYWERLATLNPR